MKVTRDTLKRIIKEELEEMMAPVDEVGTSQIPTHKETMNKIHVQAVLDKAKLIENTLARMSEQNKQKGVNADIFDMLLGDIRELVKAVNKIN